jgi:hypothetical protein
MIDVGTNNKALLKDPFYPGLRRLRVEEEVISCPFQTDIDISLSSFFLSCCMHVPYACALYINM